MGSIQKALQALLRIIRNIKSALTNLIDKRKMSEQERQAYETFQEEIKKNPELKNKKVTVRDFRKIQAEYENILREASATEQRLAAGEPVDITKITDRMENFAKEFSKSAITSVTAEAALGIAGTSRQWAAAILNTVQNDERVYNSLVESMGKKETKKFERKLKSLTKRVSLQRQIMRMKGTLTNSISDSLQTTASSLMALCGNVSKLTNKDVRNDKKQLLATGVEIAKNGGDVMKRIMGNETVRKDIKDGVGGYRGLKKTVKKTIKQEKKAIKDSEKREKKRQKAISKGKYHEQSMVDALVGTYSKNNNFANSKVGKVAKHVLDFV